MKKILLIMLVAASVVACKKDGSGSGSNKLLLSKIFRKGLLETEYIYNTEGKVVRNNNYTTGGGVSTLSTYRLYEYNNDGALDQVWHFSKAYNPTVRRVHSYNAQGKLTRVDESTIFAGDDNLDHMDYFETYEYNTGGQLVSETRRLVNYTLHSRTDYTYDNKGDLATYESWYWENGGWVLKQHMDVDPPNKPMPDHWKAMLLVPTDMNLYTFFIPGQKYTSYWSGPVGSVGIWSYLDRQYNNQGYVIKETFKIDENASERTFEYVQ